MTSPGTSDDFFSLNGLVALVVGASGGLGSAIAREFARRGAFVVLAGRRGDELRRLAKTISIFNTNVDTVIVDVTDQSSVRSAINGVLSKHGRIDVLVNAHGINFRAPAEEMPLSEWQKVLDVNLKGTFLMCQEVGKIMIKQGHGKIINISSTAAGRGFKWGYSAYSPSKAGVEALTRVLAAEWGKHGINVNAIAPYFVRTKINSEFLDNKNVFTDIVGSIPLGRLGTPDDVAAAAVFLASRASDWINGEVLHVDGGRNAI
jgi:gluconate 5-dehydrogenase